MTAKILYLSKLLQVAIVLLLIMQPVGGYALSEESTPADEDVGTSFFSGGSISGYFENRTAYRLNAPNRLSQFRNLLQLELRDSLSDWGELYLQIWNFYDSVYDINPDDFPDAVQDEYRSNLTADKAGDQTFRELYLDILLDAMDIRLGKQQVVWGEAIGLRITDVVNPQDYRDFILDDFTNSRIPVWMAKFNYYVDDWGIELLWIPLFEPDREALTGSDWEWTFNRIEPSPGMAVRFFEAEQPEADIENSETGVRITGLLSGWNLSLSYLNVWDDAAIRHIEFNPQTFNLDVTGKYHRLPLWGFTFANAFGSFVPRGEFSFAQGKYYNTADPTAAEALVQKDYLHYMVGTDYSISNYSFTLQWVQKIILDYDEAIYEGGTQTSYSVWVQANLLNETLKPELLAIFSPSDEGWIARPKIAYNLTDTIIVTAGADLFAGPERSFFGQFDENDQLYTRFKYSF